MSGRTIILILFFWAVLTIVTPILVRLSASAKANGEFFVIKHTGELKAGKMMGLLPRRALHMDDEAMGDENVVKLFCSDTSKMWSYLCQFL
ncbi:hypothetical protein MTR67_021028 [Solanum verrucosum]|uniref:Uncharacterized protein n=1 Tax=Solanum verrucosum TaxID=315347 RepID=A0AAF0QQV0_SOLVR|nr:hypothetical protein MTR67_021028 [Solanum verrucosum]